MNMYRGAGRGPRNNRFDFDGDPDHDRDPGSLDPDSAGSRDFKGLFIYY